MKDEIAKKIDNFLFYEWDPIGINHENYGFDEYSNYVSHIHDFLNLKDINQLFDLMWYIETNYIGLRGNFEHTKKSAEKLYQLIHGNEAKVDTERFG